MVLPAAIPQADLVALVVQPPPPPQPQDPGGQGQDFGKSSPLGFLVLILFLVAVAFLARSMTKHLKRVPASFDEQPAEDKQDKPEQQEQQEPEKAAKPAGDEKTEG